MAQLTGRRFLGNFTSDDQQFRALMDAGVTYATAFNLRPGIALTAEQIARLTSDIVWLQQETVTLPDGTQTLALVPHIYLKPRTGDLSPSGGLISGASVNINTADLSNSGTILGRKVVQINADTINNLGGNIRGDAVSLTATQDINNTGGTITAQDKLTLQAGRDINNTSTTATASTGDSRNGITNTTVDRVAGLYVKFTKAQIEDAMRNSANKAMNESVETGMVNPGAVVEDKGAVFNVGGDGKSVVQTPPNGGKVDPELAAYIIANTGGINSPYAWSDAQTGKVKALSNANAVLNTMTPNANGCITAECAAGIQSGKATVPDGSYGVGFYPGLVPGGEVEVEVQNGEITGGKVGAGFGVGGHLNLGTKTVGGGLLQGPVSGAKGGALSESNPLQAGEVRVGPAASVNVGVGTVGLEVGASAGKSIKDDGVSNFVNKTATPTVAPVLPKISAEAKINIIEFSVKPPAQPVTTNSEDASK